MVRACVLGVVVLLALAACGRIDFDTNYAADGVADLVVRYEMGDDPSTGVAQATVEGYDGACTLCPTAATWARGGAYAFTGGQVIQLPMLSAALVGVAPYTVTVWADGAVVANQTDAEHQLTIVEKPTSLQTQENVFKVFIDQGGQATFETSGYDEFAPSSTDLRGSWHAFAASWDGTTKRLYVDGALTGSDHVTITDSELALTIGADLDSNIDDEHYTGQISDLRFYRRALLDEEVARIAQ